MSKILTFSGRYVDVFDLKPNDICITDIAHALANQCRFTGHCSRFYSVAEHSVRVSKLLTTTETKKFGLLHDAAEAYLVDLATPIKEQCIGYRLAEERAIRTILNKFGLGPVIPSAIHHADKLMLEREMIDLMPRTEENRHFRSEVGRVYGWEPELAKAAFITRYQELWGK